MDIKVRLADLDQLQEHLSVCQDFIFLHLNRDVAEDNLDQHAPQPNFLDPQDYKKQGLDPSITRRNDHERFDPGSKSSVLQNRFEYLDSKGSASSNHSVSQFYRQQAEEKQNKWEDIFTAANNKNKLQTDLQTVYSNLKDCERLIKEMRNQPTIKPEEYISPQAQQPEKPKPYKQQVRSKSPIPQTRAQPASKTNQVTPPKMNVLRQQKKKTPSAIINNTTSKPTQTHQTNKHTQFILLDFSENDISRHSHQQSEPNSFQKEPPQLQPELFRQPILKIDMTIDDLLKNYDREDRY